MAHAPRPPSRPSLWDSTSLGWVSCEVWRLTSIAQASARRAAEAKRPQAFVHAHSDDWRLAAILRQEHAAAARDGYELEAPHAASRLEPCAARPLILELELAEDD